MALFKKGVKKKPEPVMAYSEIEQGAAPLPVLPKAECACEECVKLKKVLENQQTIVLNQQVILNSVESLAKLVVSLAEDAPVPEEEPTDEEIQAAILAARAAKKGAGRA